MIHLYPSRFPEEATHRMVQQMAQTLREGRRAFFVVPGQFTVEAEQTLFDALHTDVLMQAQVKSFPALVRDILQSGSGLRKPVLSEAGRRMLLRYLLETGEDAFTVFSSRTRREGLLDRLLREMKEWKEYGIGPDKLLSLAGSFTENDRSRGKFEELALLYARYEEFLKEKGEDADDRLLSAFQQIRELPVFDGIDFYFDRFHSMSKLEREALALLHENGNAIHISLLLEETMAEQIRTAPADASFGQLRPLFAEKTADADVFTVTARFAWQLAGISPLENHLSSPVTLRPPTPVSSVHREETGKDETTNRAPRASRPLPILMKAEQALFAFGDAEEEKTAASAISADSDSAEADAAEHRAVRANASPERNEGAKLKEGGLPLRLIRYRNVDQEVDGLVMAIKKRIQAGARYRDILVYLGEDASYGPLVERAFRFEGIPFFRDTVKPATYHPLMQAVHALLSIARRGLRPQSLLMLLKTGLCGVGEDDADLYQNFVMRRHIRYGMFEDPKYFRADPHAAPKREEAAERYFAEYERAAAVNEALLAWLGPFRRMQEKEPVRAFAAALVHTLRQPASVAALQAYGSALQQEGEEDRFAVHGQTWEALLRILDEMVLLFGEQVVSTDMFATMLQEGLQDLSLGIIPPYADSVFVGDLLRSRVQPRQDVFLLGLNDGVLPGNRMEDGLLTDEEKALLLEKEERLPSMHDFASEEEQLNFYTILLQARRQLTLSASGQNLANEPMELSYWMSTISEELGIPVQQAAERSLSDALYLKRRLLTDVPEVLRLPESAPEDKAMAHAIFDYFQHHADFQEDARQMQRAMREGETRPPLSSEMVQRLYPAEVVSATQLETFAACPYRYFVQYGLRPDEPREWEVDALDIGNLLHTTMDAWTAFVSGRLEEAREITPEESAQLAAAAMEEQEKMLLDTEKREDPRNDFLLQQAGKTALETQERLYHHLLDSRISRMDHEEGFGRHQKLPGILLSVSPRRITLEGRIDRIDHVTADGNEWVQVVDYKTGAKEFNLSNVLAGTYLQLPLYLAAASGDEAKPAGAFYLPVHAPKAELRETESSASGEDSERSDSDGTSPAGNERPAPKKEEKMDGVLLAEEQVEGFDTALSDPQQSVFLLRGRGEWKERDNVLSSSEMQALLSESKERAGEFVARREAGDIAVRPVWVDAAGGSRGCNYCPFRGLCRFELQRDYAERRVEPQVKWPEWKKQQKKGGEKA